MNNIKHKSKAPSRVLNDFQEINADQFRRFIRIDYPIYCLPVEIKEKKSEPYEELEKNIELLLLNTEIESREKLFKTLGISKFKELCNNTLDYLISISHIRENEGVLALTKLGRESIQSGKRIHEERSSRLIYFDAMSLKPLPSSYYNPREANFFSPVDFDNFKRANIIDIWDEFNHEKLDDLLNLKGDQRLDYNIPQEATEILLDKSVLEIDLEDVVTKGVINYISLYCLIYDPLDKFMEKRKKADYWDLNICVLNGTSGKRDNFFEHLIDLHKGKLKNIFSPILKHYNPLVSSNGIWQWGLPLLETFKESEFIFNKDQNITLKLSKNDVGNLMEDNNQRVINSLAFNPVLPLTNNKHNGRLLFLDMESEARDMLINSFLNCRKETLIEQDKSKEYIEKNLQDLHEKIKAKWMEGSHEI